MVHESTVWERGKHELLWERLAESAVTRLMLSLLDPAARGSWLSRPVCMIYYEENAIRRGIRLGSCRRCFLLPWSNFSYALCWNTCIVSAAN